MSRSEKTNREAADWLITLQEDDLSAEDLEQFEAWLAASDGNKAAYWRLEAAWEEADRIRALGLPEKSAPTEIHRFSLHRLYRPLGLAASIAVAVGLWTFAPQLAGILPQALSAQDPAPPQSFATSLGMKKLIGLQDGSRIQLNTASVLRAQITKQRREVWLERGEAFFEVAHRQGQPFVVHAGDRQITVLGTKFSVRRDGEKVIVSVLEGRVRVDELKDNRLLRSSVIVGGNIAMAEGAATLVTERSADKVQDSLSWRTGMLTFDQTPLPAIAAEFNRYNARKIVIDGEALENVRISGTFPSEKPDAFARLLRDAYGFRLDTSTDQIRVSQ